MIRNQERYLEEYLMVLNIKIATLALASVLNKAVGYVRGGILNLEDIPLLKRMRIWINLMGRVKVLATEMFETNEDDESRKVKVRTMLYIVGMTHCSFGEIYKMKKLNASKGVEIEKGFDSQIIELATRLRMIDENKECDVNRVVENAKGIFKKILNRKEEQLGILRLIDGKNDYKQHFNITRKGLIDDDIMATFMFYVDLCIGAIDGKAMLVITPSQGEVNIVVAELRGASIEYKNSIS